MTRECVDELATLVISCDVLENEFVLSHVSAFQSFLFGYFFKNSES